MNWQHINIDGKRKNLRHLRSFTFTHQISNGNDTATTSCDIDVAFSLHCFTRASKSNDKNILMLGNERRCFCNTRYTHSFKLPEIVTSLDERHIRQSGRGNYFTVEFIDDEGTRLNYEVYFRLTKPSKKQNLQLFVESAYIRTNSDPFRNKKKKIRFKVLVNAVKHGRKIRI